MRIYWKLIIIFLALSLTPIIFIGYTFFYNVKVTMQKEILSKLNTIADLEVDKIESFFRERSSDISVLAYRDIIKSAFPVLDKFKGDTASPAYVEAKETLNSRLVVFQSAYKYIDIILVNMEGKIVYAYNPMRQSEVNGFIPEKDNVFEKIKTGIYVGDVHRSGHREHPYVLNLARQVQDDAGRIVGIIYFELDMNILYKYLLEESGLGKSWEVLLVGKTANNEVIFLSPLRYDSGSVLHLSKKIGSKEALPAQKALLEKSGSGLSVDYRGREVLSAWRMIPSLGWGLVVKIDTNEVFLPIDKLKTLFIVILFVAFISIVMTVFAVAKSISEPIHKLYMGTKIVGAGDFSYRIGEATNDEIGKLSHAFDEMTAELKSKTTSIDNLSREIDERKKAQAEAANILWWQENVNEFQRLLLSPLEFESKLNMITENVKRIFKADFCRIWLIRPGDLCGQDCVHAKAKEELYLCRNRNKCLHLVASSGRHTQDRRIPLRIPLGCYKIGALASGQEHKFLSNDVANEPRVHDHGWVRELGLVSFAGYQLKIPEGENYGVLAIFAKHPILPAEDAILDSLSATIAFVVHKYIADERLKVQAQELKSSLEEVLKSRAILTSMLDDNNNIREKLEQNIAELKRSQSMLIQSEKLASMGKLVSEIAHEVNNPLMIISGNAQVSLMSGPVSVEVEKNLKIIVEECQRTKGIIQRLLKFSRPSKGEIKEVDANKMLEALIYLLEPEFKLCNIEIKRDFQENLPAVAIDEQLIHEAFMNIVYNAKDAMPNGGIFIIGTSLEGEFVRVDFKDTGSGMSEDAKKNLFAPFFTTKEKGTGLGLAICYGIVKAHNGNLRFESELNKGTTASVILPKAKGA